MQTVEKLRKVDNVFALVMESAWQGLEKFKKGDQDLYLLKIDLIRKLMAKGCSKEKTRRIIEFIQYYVDFEESKISNIFDKQLNLIAKERSPMGIEETILEELKREGREGK